MDQKETLVDGELKLVVVLPGGVEKTATVHGSKPMMDLLVMLCAQYHLNPSSHTIELVSANRNHVKFKPNALIGALEAEKILIKPKCSGDKDSKAGPRLPEATVRLVVNYKKTQKTILRVSPQVPLGDLIPAICEKCDFDQKTTVLWRDLHSEEPLDLTKSLNDFGLRELYARDAKGAVNAEDCLLSPAHQGAKSPSAREKENKGLFSLFRRSKKKSERATSFSGSASPVLAKQRSGSITQASAHVLSTAPSDVPKKRRAPQPPSVSPHCVPLDLGSQESDDKPASPAEGFQEKTGLSRGFSESSLRRTKRKAPPPPCTIPQGETSLDGSSEGVTSPDASTEISDKTALSSGVESHIQGGECSPNKSTDVEEKSASYTVYIEMQGSIPVEEMEEKAPCGQSSDGKQAGISTTHKDSSERAPCTDETNCLGLEAIAEAGNDQMQASGEKIPALSITGEPVHLLHTHLSHTPPATQEVEVQTLVPLIMEALETNEPGSVKAQVVAASPSIVLRPTLPEPQKTPPALDSSAPDWAQFKRDVSTSMEEENPDPTLLEPAREGLTAPVFIGDLQPKIKPSDELTRGYTPKVGLTTYTIVPPKSKEKLRFFEVELTLETPGMGESQEGFASSPEQVDHSSQTDKPQDSADGSALSNLSLRDSPLVTNNPVAGNDISAPHAVVHDLDQALDLPPTCDEGTWVYTVPQRKKNKVPPPIKPKPGSFHLPQHKCTPGYYVTSAAEKDVAASTGERLSRRHSERGVSDNGFPPPPPPLDWDEEAGADHRGESVPRVTQQWSVPFGELSASLNIEKLRSLAAPKPYGPATPSPFAQAVALAVKRSASFTRESASSKPSFTGQNSAEEWKGLSENEENSSLQPVVIEAVGTQDPECHSPVRHGDPVTNAGEAWTNLQHA